MKEIITHKATKPAILVVMLGALVGLGSCVSQPRKIYLPDVEQMPTAERQKDEIRHIEQGRVIVEPPSVQPPVYQPPVQRPPTYQPPVQQPPTYQPPTYPPSATTNYRHFDDWKQDFANKATQQYGANAQRLLAGSDFSQAVVNLDRKQAEFSKMPWEYLDSATPASRVNQGRQKRRENLSLMERNEQRYGVPASIITAIWGVETSYGANMGSTDLADALSTLAYEGRRRSFAENQLYAMMELYQRGDLSSLSVKGSHAGGMGHMQFIPETWLRQGVDGDGDGRKNPFALADALTSASNYLANAGWVRDLLPFYEVRLPSGFNHGYIGKRLPLTAWRQMGVVPMGDDFGGQQEAELWLPAGINGPALLLTKNFDVIKVYNNSSNYALAVAVLAHKINGKAGIHATFPRHERPLSSSQIQRLQHNLTTQGYDTKGVDGVAGANTRQAFARWQADNGRIPDGFISQQSAGHLTH